MGLAVGTLKQSSTSLLPLMFDLLVCMTTQVSSQPKTRGHEGLNVDRAKVKPAWSPSLKFIVTHLASSTLARSTFKRSCRRKPCKNETSAVIPCWLFLNRDFSGHTSPTLTTLRIEQSSRCDFGCDDTCVVILTKRSKSRELVWENFKLFWKYRQIHVTAAPVPCRANHDSEDSTKTFGVLFKEILANLTLFS